MIEPKKKLLLILECRICQADVVIPWGAEIDRYHICGQGELNLEETEKKKEVKSDADRGEPIPF